MTPPLVTLVRDAVAALFPQLAGFVLSARSGGLRVLSAASKALHLAGDAGDPFAARVGDFVVRLILKVPISGPIVLYYSTDAEAPYNWTPIATVVVAPSTSNPGTELRIVTGSGKVTIAT